MKIINDMKTITYTTYRDIKDYFSHYFKLIVYMQLILLFFAIPLLGFMLSQMFRIAGVDGITESNFMQLFKQPLGVIMLLLSIFISVMIIFIEMTIYIYSKALHQHKKPFILKDYIHFILNRATKIVVFQFLIFFFYFIILIPLTGMQFIATLSSNIRLPNFISGELLKSQSGTILYFSILIAVLYINLRLILTLYVYMLSDTTSIVKAMKISFKLTRKRSLRMIGIGFIYTFAFLFVIAVVQVIILLPVLLADTFVIHIAFIVAGIMLTIFMIFSFILLGIAKITLTNILYYFYQQANHKEVRVDNTVSQSKPIPVLLTTSLCMYIIFLVITNTIVLHNFVYQVDTLIIAHRGGDIYNAVENTLESLEAVVEDEPDIVELDVMETKDGELIIFHDTTLRRLANDNRSIANLTYNELKTIPLQANGHTGYIPTLEQFIIVAKQYDIPLLLEVKLHGYESKDMLKNIVDLLVKYEVDDEYYIQSFDHAVLNQIRELDPKIKQSYVIALHFGNLIETNTEYITIEDFSARSGLVKQANNRGVGVFVWTINDPNLMLKHMSNGVSGIITNRVQMAQSAKRSIQEANTIRARLELMITKLTK